MRGPHRATLVGITLTVSVAVTACVTATDTPADGTVPTVAAPDTTVGSTTSPPSTRGPTGPAPEWPAARRGHAMVADGLGGLVVFGGRSIEAGSRTYLADTWRYDTASGTWSRIEAPDAPSLRSEHTLTATGSPGTVLLFGGYTGDRFTYGDIWEFDGTAWTRIRPATAPPARAGAVAAHDPGSDVVVLFGGAERPTVAELPTDETWVLDGRTWVLRSPRPAPRPRSEGHPTLFELALVHDTGSDRSILIIGGDETWAYDADADVWERRADPGLDADFMVAAAYDARLDRVVTHGGGPTSLSDETWLYDYDGDRWELVDTTTSPGPIGDHAMTYDPVTERTYLFGGGVDLLPLDGVGDVTAALWVFDGEDWARLGPPPPGVSD